MESAGSVLHSRWYGSIEDTNLDLCLCEHGWLGQQSRLTWLACVLLLEGAVFFSVTGDSQTHTRGDVGLGGVGLGNLVGGLGGVIVGTACMVHRWSMGCSIASTWLVKGV